MKNNTATYKTIMKILDIFINEDTKPITNEPKIVHPMKLLTPIQKIYLFARPLVACFQ